MSETYQPATMAEYSALEMLAPEIQLQILVNADTPKDLYALIQASPRLYQVYLLNKDLALSAVAYRQFHPAVTTEALFFAKISQLEQPLSRSTVMELCKIYPGKLQEELTIPIPMSVKLCEFASNIRFFIEDYTRNTLPIMEGLGRSLETDILPSYSTEDSVSCSKLSDSEAGRLQRAFCRFEIYRTFFARCSSDLNHDLRRCSDELPVRPAEQASMFFEKLPDFQVTEIICIRDYLYRRLRGICSQLEDEAASTLPPETFMFDRDGDFESAEWASGVYLFTENGKYYQNQHIEHLMSLGLAYIRQIFDSTGEEQKNLFVRHSDAIVDHLETDFVTMTLEVLEQKRNPVRGDLPLLAKTDPPFEYEINTDAYLDIPDAWQWAHPRAPPLCLVEKTLKGLRDWGYVFWDIDRLRESGMLGRK